jgi:hypothetical protein
MRQRDGETDPLGCYLVQADMLLKKKGTCWLAKRQTVLPLVYQCACERNNRTKTEWRDILCAKYMRSTTPIAFAASTYGRKLSLAERTTWSATTNMDDVW